MSGESALPRKLCTLPEERAFQTFNDYDAWPRFSSLFRRVTVIERAGNTVRVQAEGSVDHED